MVLVGGTGHVIDHAESLQALIGSSQAQAVIDYCFVSSSFPPPKGLMRRLQSGLKAASLRYPDSNDEISAKIAAIEGIKPAHVISGNGASELICAVVREYVRRIVIPVPTFSEYDTVARSAARDIEWHHLSADNGFRLEPMRLIDHARTSGANTVLLVNPNNPTGWHLKRSEMHALLEGLRNLDLIIVDESFIDYVSLKPPSMIRMLERYENVVIIKSLSKRFACPGLRLGYLASGNKLRTQALRGVLPRWNINCVAQSFLEMVPDYRAYYEHQRVRVIDARGEFVAGLCNVAGLRVHDSASNFVLCNLLHGRSSVWLQEELLGKGFYIRAFPNKIGLSPSYFRVAILDRASNRRLVRAIDSVVHTTP